MIEQAFSPLVYVDTNIFIDFLQGAPDRVALLEEMFDRFKQAPGAATTSELALAEILGKKAPGIRWEDQRDFYDGLFLFE